jgi:hypothetical protein
MQEEHRLRNGMNEWRALPPGYRPLRERERIKAGDIQKLNNDWYAEYQKGILINTLPSGKWYRKMSAEELELAAAPARKTDREIVEGANALARALYELRGYVTREGYRFDKATHPHEVEAWRAAVLAYEHINGTDVENALAECGDDI